MITLNVYPSAHDRDALAAKANAVLENYKSHQGIVLRTNSRPSDTGSARGAFHRGDVCPAKLYRGGFCAL